MPSFEGAPDLWAMGTLHRSIKSEIGAVQRVIDALCHFQLSLNSDFLNT